MPVTRNQLNGWIRRQGLVREERPWPRWVNGNLQVNPVWCYRFGDVRDMAARAAARG